jgi:hypothetical protein
MSLRRFALALAGVTAAALVAALPAAGKEGVKATLRTSIPLHAAAGARLEVRWTLAYVDQDGRRRPFGANGVFVRLRSTSGARAETGLAPNGSYPTGAYAATVVVPEGGIGDVEIGLRGWADGRPSALLFPITNDPTPGPARVAAPASGSERSGSGSTAWVVIVVASLLSMLAVLVVALRRRRNATRLTSAPDAALDRAPHR